jgi:hypothetical protein
MKKCINGRLGVNFSLVEFLAIREISKKRSLLTGVRTVNGIRSMQSIHSLNQRQAEEAGVMATRRWRLHAFW